MVPPQDRPTFHAVSSATPNSKKFGSPLQITSSASVTTAPSTQPPDTLPKKVPSSLITRLEPAGRGAEPQVSTTVASATPWPAFCQSSAACRISSSRLSVVVMGASLVSFKLLQAAGRIALRWCGGAAADNAAISPSIELKLCTGRNSSTCGSIILIPCALASKPPKRSSGLSQIRRRHDLCSRSISNASLASASRSSPSEINSTMAPCPSTRRPQSLLNVCSEVAIRAPPPQSSTLSEQLARASSGSRARSARVTLVSLVPNRTTETRLRASVMACRKCRNSLVYSLIEPDISR